MRCHAGKRIIALDFDGVVCDSVGESSLSAIRAAERQWPEMFGPAKSRHAELVEKMRGVRPVIETGYENIVQIRCLLEGMEVDEMLEGWHQILPAMMKKWQLDRQALVKLFGDVRDEWIAADLDGWLAPNRIYEGVAEPIRVAMGKDEVYIVTTKQAHYTKILLANMASIDMDPNRIYSQTLSGKPKTEVLEKLERSHPEATVKLFVEDKLSTLEKVAADPAFNSWELYLVDWGYNTPSERRRASSNPRIKVLRKEEFISLVNPVSA
jgi:phosphoglycolate phosphatase-like HAD superfamily hydrolase